MPDREPDSKRVTITFPFGVTISYADRDAIAERIATAVGDSVSVVVATAVSHSLAKPDSGTMAVVVDTYTNTYATEQARGSGV